MVNDFTGYINQAASRQVFTHTLASGPKKFMGIAQLVPDGVHRRVDIELVDPEEYPFALAYFTGSATFNVKMRSWCEQHGFTLNEKQLIENKTGQRYYATNEEQLFTMVGLKYLTPAERDRGLLVLLDGRTL
jgi:DNA polymerase/3'-5' exonuclease PolX